MVFDKSFWTVYVIYVENCSLPFRHVENLICVEKS